MHPFRACFQVSLIAEHCEGPLPYVLAIVISLLFVGQGTLTQRGGALIYHKHTTVIQARTKKPCISALIFIASLALFSYQQATFSRALSLCFTLRTVHCLQSSL